MKTIVYYNSKVAENARRIIKAMGIKQSAIAEKAGYTTQELNDMLNGRRIIKAIDIEKLAIVLNTDANELLGIRKNEKEAV